MSDSRPRDLLPYLLLGESRQVPVGKGVVGDAMPRVADSSQYGLAGPPYPAAKDEKRGNDPLAPENSEDRIRVLQMRPIVEGQPVLSWAPYSGPKVWIRRIPSSHRRLSEAGSILPPPTREENSVITRDR